MSWLLQPNVFLALVPLGESRDKEKVGEHLDRAAGGHAVGVWDLLSPQDPRYEEAFDSLLAGMAREGHPHRRVARGIVLVANSEGKMMLRSLAVATLVGAGPPR